MLKVMGSEKDTQGEAVDAEEKRVQEGPRGTKAGKKTEKEAGGAEGESGERCILETEKMFPESSSQLS